MMDDLIARWRLLKGTIRWLELALAAASLALAGGENLNQFLTGRHVRADLTSAKGYRAA